MLAQAPPVNFTQYTANDGLPGGTVFALLQDHQGWLWTGTITGLARYDGFSFRVFPIPEVDSLPTDHQNITALAEDASGSIWIGAGTLVDMGGQFRIWQQQYAVSGRIDTTGHRVRGATLFRWDRRTEAIQPITFHPAPTGHSITSLHADRKGYLWVGTLGGGLHRLALDQLTEAGEFPPAARRHFRYQPDIPGAFPGSLVQGNFVETAEGALWFPTDRGMARYDPDSESFRRIPFFPGESYDPRNHCLNLLAQADQPHRFWIGTLGGGLYDFDSRSETFRQYRADPHNPDAINSDLVSAFTEDRHGRLWVGSGIDSEARLDRFDPATGRFQACRSITAGTGISFYGVHTALVDRGGLLWFGVRGTGLFRHDPADDWFHLLPAGTPQGVSDRYLFSLIASQTGATWVGTENSGLYRWWPQDGRLEHFTEASGLRHHRIMGIAESRSGRIWVGHSAGVDYWEGPSGETAFTALVAPGLSAMDLLVDRDDALWVGNWGGGLYYWTAEADPAIAHYPFQSSGPGRQPFNLVYRLVADPTHGIWVCSRGGLARFDPEQKTYEVFYDHAGVKDLAIDARGNLWLASVNNNGLLHIDPQTRRVTKLRGELGLQNIPVRGLQLDHHGDLWVVSARGISQVDPVARRVKRHFDRSTWGLDDQHWIHTVMRTDRDAAGRLYFSSRAGVLTFHPDSIRRNETPPPVVLTDFRLFGTSVVPDAAGPLTDHIAVAEQITLSHWQNDLTFAYAALDFKAPARNAYEYRLHPYDQDWRPAGNQRTAGYTNLSPGNYTFQVRAANSDGMWNETGRSVSLTILPPWWRTGWATALWIALAGGLLYAGYRFQLDRRLAAAETRRLQEVDALKTRLYTNITHEFRTPLTIILGTADLLRKEVGERLNGQLSMIRRNGRQLLRFVNMMLDLAKLESGDLRLDLQQGDIVNHFRYLIESFHSLAESKQIELHFLSDPEELYMDYDADRLLLVVSNLISNAVKFTPAGGSVYVLLQRHADRLRVKVRDTGVGIPAELQTAVFDRFFSLHPNRFVKREPEAEGELRYWSSESTGHGIGLSLTREMVKLMGGEIGVRSELGQGSEFYFDLPITQQQARVPQVPGPTATAAAVEVTPLQIAAPAHRPGRPVLLIVEDNPDLIRYLTDCFRTDYNLLLASDGRQGIQKALHRVPDVILTDIMMPDTDGLELCRTLKAHRLTSHVPIVLLTAKVEVSDRLAGLRTGADAYLSKPFLREELLVTVEALLRQRRRLQAYYRSRAGLSTGPAPAPAAELIREDDFLAAVNGVIEAHLDRTDFSVDQLSQALYLDPSNLYRKLKALTDFSPGEYIRLFRLAQAKKLLVETPLPIGRIAADCGFADPAYFSRSFRKETGQSPSAYRETTRK